MSIELMDTDENGEESNGHEMKVSTPPPPSHIHSLTCVYTCDKVHTMYVCNHGFLYAEVAGIC